EHVGGDRFVGMLRKSRYQIITVTDAGLAGSSDPKVLAYAVANGYVVLTRNADDFQDLHDLIAITGGSHTGIMVIRSDDKNRQGMKPHEIVKAIGKLEASGTPIGNQLH